MAVTSAVAGVRTCEAVAAAQQVVAHLAGHPLRPAAGSSWGVGGMQLGAQQAADVAAVISSRSAETYLGWHSCVQQRPYASDTGHVTHSAGCNRATRLRVPASASAHTLPPTVCCPCPISAAAALQSWSSCPPCAAVLLSAQPPRAPACRCRPPALLLGFFRHTPAWPSSCAAPQCGLTPHPPSSAAWSAPGWGPGCPGGGQGVRVDRERGHGVGGGE